MIQIRQLKNGDEEELWQLKVNTIKNINCKDYDEKQINAWAAAQYNPEKWLKRVQGMNPFIAEIGGQIVAFADIQADGYIDHFFCHHHFQRQAIGTALMQHLLLKGKQRAITQLYSQVSISAKPFFETFGFKVVKQQSITVGEQALTNYLMEKVL